MIIIDMRWQATVDEPIDGIRRVRLVPPLKRENPVLFWVKTDGLKEPSSRLVKLRKQLNERLKN